MSFLKIKFVRLLDENINTILIQRVLQNPWESIDYLENKMYKVIFSSLKLIEIHNEEEFYDLMCVLNKFLIMMCGEHIEYPLTLTTND